MKQDDTSLNLPSTKQSSEKDYELRSQIFHKLMPFKVREILLVSSLYDAFVIEEEGLISELVIGQYRHLLLSSPPRVTRVYSGEEALNEAKEHSYDLVITMSKNIGMDPFDFGKKIKNVRSDLPVILLATDTADLHLTAQKEDKIGIDRTFFWTGDSTLFLAIIKYVEDSVNARHDTKNGNVRVILMVEDSIPYYSMFLPVIYTEIVRQTQRSLSEDLNKMQRLLRRRARPKILIAETFEEGMKFYEEYKEYILGIITDIQFKRNEKLDKKAGFHFIDTIRKETPYVPILMQSSDEKNKAKSEEIGVSFLHKDSPSLLEDFQHFLLDHLGFGDFVFLQPKKRVAKKGLPQSAEAFHEQTTKIAHASDMTEFEYIIKKVPLESIRFHANRNDFSNWLMARAEFKLATKLRSKKVTDFTDLSEVRKHLVEVFNEARREKQLGVITDFSKQKFEFESSFTRLHGDSLGGKGRGIAFMRSLLARYDLEKKYPNIKITVPSTVVIGTLEFDRFIQENNLREITRNEDATDTEIAQAFLAGKINDELKENLKHLLKHFKSPLAIRSSSLLEDSLSHPFAGIYSTYMLPNNHKNDSIRLKQLCEAIKLVYACVFFEEPRIYISSTPAKTEEEKMAVIIQKLVGNDYGGRFYPTFSGVAQSYNFYPVGHQTFDDGIASVAVGLGKTVVGGEKVLRFSPRYPDILPDFSTPEEILQNAQRELWVLDISKKNVELSEQDYSTLKRLTIDSIKNDGALESVSSTYDLNDKMIRDSFSPEGPHLITFAGILKYGEFPLAPLLRDILDIGQRGMGCPIEIEFAVILDKENKNPPTFAILQLRPLVPAHEHCEIIWDDKMNKEEVFIHSDKALGNGVINSVKDIMYVPPKTFDNRKTLEIADEIGTMNEHLTGSSLPYILIGPGRWGTEDRFLGIPVKWSQISGVKVMVETALKDFNIKPSQGTHFFHNITSRGIGYLNVPFNSNEYFIDWNWLEKLKPKKKLKFVKHLKLSAPLIIRLDGRCGHGIVLKPKS